MADRIKVMVALPPEHAVSARCAEPASGRPYTPAHMIYRVGRGFRLYRADRTRGVSGGLMVLDTGPFIGGGPSTALADDVIEECGKNEFSGIVIDSGGNGNKPAQLSLCRTLARAASMHGLEFYVPETLAGCGETAIVRITTALSGGTLSRHLSDAVRRYGAERIALEIERVSMDFTLPALSGNGRALSAAELRKLAEQRGGRAFFSIDLAANYFTYHDKKGAHFVLYDNAQSIRHKLRAGEELGISCAFLFFPQVEEILAKILE